jgi:hypothetical protein
MGLQAKASGGFSLVVVLILLGALALASAHTMRSASSSAKVANSFHMQAMALQSAQTVLYFCEQQLLQPEAQRLAQLLDAALPVGTAAAPVWLQAARWRSAALLSPPASWLASGVLPVCMVEKQPLGAGHVHVVTARGFSPDWRGDTEAATLGGSAVWLQSVVLVDAGEVRDRVQRRLLQPPVR